MSADDVKMVEETLKGLMVPDNTLRRQAEVKLEELMVNKPGLILCLSSILLGKLNFNFTYFNRPEPSFTCKGLRKCCNQKAFRNQRY
jgi:hypothetical protein